MKIDWRQAVAGGLMSLLIVAVAGCASAASVPLPDVASSAKPGDPDSRVFAGLIVSLRRMSSTMVISKDEGRGEGAYPNFIHVKYDATTRFLLDDHPATLVDIEQYMKVKIDGHMRDGQLFAETANFSSVPSPNVKHAAQAKE
ncbi:MAG: hypothetical protein FWD61_05685 [Phycisphaerales bacterium]|nr:hypothetical protein [Phycisphaerales bacterium]